MTVTAIFSPSCSTLISYVTELYLCISYLRGFAIIRQSELLNHHYKATRFHFQYTMGNKPIILDISLNTQDLYSGRLATISVMYYQICFTPSGRIRSLSIAVTRSLYAPETPQFITIINNFVNSTVYFCKY